MQKAEARMHACGSQLRMQVFYMQAPPAQLLLDSDRIATALLELYYYATTSA